MNRFAWVAMIAIAAACGGNKQKPKPEPVDSDAAGAVGTAVIDAGVIAAPSFDAMPVPAAQTNTIGDQWWKDPANCPNGTKLSGAAPPDGTMVSCQDGNYTDTGPATHFHSNGTKSMEGLKKRGEYDGLWTYYYDNGQKRLEESFVGGKRNGPSYQWYANGQRRLSGGFVDGKPHGTYRAWDENGTELGTYFVDHGTGDITTWYPDGAKAAEGALVDGEQHGPWISYHPNGQKSDASTYEAGKRAGLATSWDENGNKRSEGNYVAGNWSGDWTYWDENGAITRVDTYGADGQKTVQRDYQDGEPLGVEPKPPGPCATNLGVVQTWDKAEGRAPSTDDDGACVWRAWGFPGVIILGSFAHDRGCRPMATFIDCEIGEWTSAEILARAGWSEAKQPARETIAMRYLEQIHTKFGSGITHDPAKPVIKSSANGSVTITAWTARPSGMMPGRTIDKNTFSFSAAGSLTVKHVTTKDER